MMKLRVSGREHQPAFRRGNREDEADDKAAGDVYHDGAPGEDLAGFLDVRIDQAAEAEAQHAAERAAQADDKILGEKLHPMRRF